MFLKNNITYDEFLNEFLNKKRDFSFKLLNIHIDFYYRNGNCYLQINDDYFNKLYKLDPPERVNEIKINSKKLKDIWRFLS